MNDIFVSYRRRDSPATVGRLIDHMKARFGKERVFRDLESTDYGQDFRKVIDNALVESEIVLVVIGRDWLAAKDENGKPRLQDDQDWVRFEVSRAFELKKKVIPVLVDNASMPSTSLVPNDMQALTKLSAAKVREDPDFDRDIEWLFKAISKFLTHTPNVTVRSSFAQPSSHVAPQTAIEGTSKPTNIKHTYKWKLFGSEALTSFTLVNAHEIKYSRKEGLRQTIRLFLDDSLIFEKVMWPIGSFEHYFQVEDADCEVRCKINPFVIRMLIRVNGYPILDV